MQCAVHKHPPPQKKKKKKEERKKKTPAPSTLTTPHPFNNQPSTHRGTVARAPPTSSLGLGLPSGWGSLAGLPVLRSLSDGAAMRASIYTPFVSVDEDAGVVGIEWNGISVRSLSGAARLLRRCGTESESGGDLLGKKHP